MGDLFLGLLHDLFPDHLSDHEPLYLISHNVIRIIFWSLGQALDDIVQKKVDAVPLERRDRYYFPEGIKTAVGLDNRKHLRLLFRINLIYDKEGRLPQVLQHLYYKFIAGAGQVRLCHEHNKVDLSCSTAGLPHNNFSKFVLWPVYARGINKDYLGLRQRLYPKKPVAGGLGFRRYNRNLFSENGV